MREGSEPQHGNAYNIFILVLTIFSLVIMGLLILPLDADTLDLLRVYDNVICVVFLIDFALNLRQATLEARVLLPTSRLAGPDRIDPQPWHPALHRPVPARSAQPAGPDHAPAARREEEGADRGRRQESRPVRAVHHRPVGDDRDDGLERARAAVRVKGGRQHPDRRRRAVVGAGDDHHRRLRRLLSRSRHSVG